MKQAPNCKPLSPIGCSLPLHGVGRPKLWEIETDCRDVQAERQGKDVSLSEDTITAGIPKPTAKHPAGTPCPIH